MADQEVQEVQPVATDANAPVQVAPVVPVPTERPFKQGDDHQALNHGGFGTPIKD